MFTDISIHHINKMDRGLAYAEACFETFRVIHGDIFCWRQHWQRLTLGLEELGIALDKKHERLILQSCLAAAKKEADDCLVRLTVSGGEADWGLLQSAQPSVSLQTMPFKATQTPFTAIPIAYPFALLPKVAKFTADYAQTLRAIQVWQSPNPMLNILCHDGHVIGGLTANVVLFSQGKWQTPQGIGVLPGVVRQFLLKKKLIHATKCPVSMLSTCEAMVLINSGTFLTIVHSIRGRKLYTKHPAISALKTALQQEKGVSITDV
ncbi:MAG: aminotransferase class IV [Ghiorsea sp.]